VDIPGTAAEACMVDHENSFVKLARHLSVGGCSEESLYAAPSELPSLSSGIPRQQPVSSSP
jgi:hypothetical protein